MQSEYRVDKVDLSELNDAGGDEPIDSVALGTALSRQILSHLPTSPEGSLPAHDPAGAAGSGIDRAATAGTSR